MPEFDLKEVFIKAWGYEPPANFNIEKAAARKEQSDLGQPFYAKDAQGREHFLPVFINNVLLPLCSNWY
ncbi:MAG: hypothetical protein IPP48_03410 [Chitinophagaceae bacterium]|nr:hypothetical protein [Chitinophagaceae bacterium]